MISSGFESFFNDHFHKAVLVALSVVSHTAVAEDIVQDVFVRMLDKFGAIKDPSRYLYASVKNASIDYVRSRTADLRRPGTLAGETDIQGDDPREREDKYADDLIKLFKAIDNLPVKARKVVELICFEKYSYNDAARELGMPLATVKTHMYRALRTLRNNMAFLMI